LLADTNDFGEHVFPKGRSRRGARSLPPVLLIRMLERERDEWSLAQAMPPNGA
jgi:hypothetical protein